MSRIVTITSLFPSSAQPPRGLFVHDRMHRVAARGGFAWQVVAPVPDVVWPLRTAGWRRWRATPLRESWEGVEALHPRWRHWPGMIRRQARAMADGVRATVAALAAREPIVIDAHYLWPDGVAAAAVARELGVPYTLTARGTDVNVLAQQPAVRAKIAAFEPGKDAFVVDLVDDDLKRWRLERFEEGVEGGPYARDEGAYEAPSVRENLRATGRVRFAAKAGGVKVGAAADPRERAKEGRQLAPSHRVVVAWQPMQFRSQMERPNRARPTSGPRPQFLTAGSVRVAVKVVDLVQDVERFDRVLTVDLPFAEPQPVDKLDAFAVQLGDLAKAAVAEAIFFALQPPVVTRKWAAGDAGEWHVEVAMPRRVALAYESFAVGVQGSLASPDWRPLGRAVYVGGADAQCTFRLVDVVDASRIEEGVAEVRPARK